MERIYDKPLSESVKKLMVQVMKQSTNIVQGFIFFRNRTIIKAYYDPEGCSALLKAMVINEDNVLSYLKRKYVPTRVEGGCLFKDQKCIQKAMVKEDGTLFMHIANSEPHKIITDTIHVMSILRAEGFTFRPEVKYYIEQLKIAYQDTLLYNHCIEEFGFKVPAPAKIYERQLKQKYSRLEEVAKIKKRSVKRKFLRYHVKRGMMTWKQLRDIINMAAEDYTLGRIRQICERIRQENRDAGIEIDY